MLRITVLLIFLFLQSIYGKAFQKDIRKDTVVQDSVNLSFPLRLSDKRSDVYAKSIHDSTLLQFSSGISIINSLRGQVPNLTIAANAFQAMGNVRLGNTSLVLDGIPFHNSFTRLMPIHAFDYRSITVFSNPNALTAVDNITDGAILLESKSGRGHFNPFVEINSYTTFGKFDQGQSDPIWYFTNSAAYAQDFGKVDTRISYTRNASNPDYKYRNPLSHTFNTNTGFRIAPKFTAQLITNANLQQQKPFSIGGFFPSTSMYKQDFLNASILLRYQFTNRLYLASKANASHEDYYQKSETQTGLTERKYDNVRQMANLFLNYDQTFGKVNTQWYAGVQNARQRYNTTLFRDGLLTGTYEATVSSPSFVAGTSVMVNNLVSVNGNLRISKYSSLPDAESQKKNYSVGFSFLPLALIEWPSLSFAKLRATYGVRTPWAFWNYPQPADPQGSFGNPRDKNYAEAGLDLTFLNQRLSFTVNYFNNLSKSNSVNIGGGIGGGVTVINLGDLRTSGTEWIISAVPVITPALKYEVSALLSSCNVKIESTQNGGNSNLLLGSPLPDWRTSLYNAVTWKNLTVNVLVEASKGGTYFTRTVNGSTLVDGSFVKLRDVSIGYWLPVSMIDKLGLSKLWLSTSFRNPIIYTQDGYDAESTFEAQKTISVNVYAAF